MQICGERIYMNGNPTIKYYNYTLDTLQNKKNKVFCATLKNDHLV